MNFLGTGPSRDVLRKKCLKHWNLLKGGAFWHPISWLLQFTTPWNKDFKFEVLLGGSNTSFAITEVLNLMYGDFP